MHILHIHDSCYCFLLLFCSYLSRFEIFPLLEVNVATCVMCALQQEVPVSECEVAEEVLPRQREVEFLSSQSRGHIYFQLHTDMTDSRDLCWGTRGSSTNDRVWRKMLTKFDLN